MTNPQIVFKDAIDTRIVEFTCAKFTLDDVEVHFTDFLDGFKNANIELVKSYNSMDAIFGGNERRRLTDFKKLSSTKFTLLSNEVFYTTGSHTLTYSGKKIFSPMKTTPLGFVLGNKLDQYPQNGQQGNYWYELIGQINSANVYSLNEKLLTNIKNDTVTEIKQEVQNG